MTSRRDAVTARLRKKLEEWDSHEFRRYRRAALDREGKRDLSDENVWADAAREAFGCRVCEEEGENDVLGWREDSVLMNAFWTFNLDPADPRDWRALLDVFAEVLAPELSTIRGEYVRAGAPRKWPPMRRVRLVAAVDKIKRGAGRKMTDLEACERLKQAPASHPDIKSTSAEALVRQVVEGRRLIRRAHSGEDTPVPVGLWRKLTSN